jgi:hypothetical protein
VLQEVEITVEARFPPTVRDPDLVVVNRSVVDRNPVRIDASDVVLVVEIVSPGSRRTDRVMKAYEYAKAGIEHYWIAISTPTRTSGSSRTCSAMGAISGSGLSSVTGYEPKNRWRWTSRLTS